MACRPPLLLSALALSSCGSGGPQVANLELDLTACLAPAGAGDGSCGAALRARFDGPVPVCLALRGLDGDAVVLLQLDPETGRSLPGAGQAPVTLGLPGEPVQLRLFYLAPDGGEPASLCAAPRFSVDAACAETEGCLLATRAVEVRPDGSGTVRLAWGGAGPPCVFECGDEGLCGGVGEARELCDGRDNDCDGEVDEGYHTGVPCGASGVCSAGVIECVGPDTTACSTLPGGTDDRSGPEVCNGLDDDCNGVADDGLADEGGACEVAGRQGVCLDGVWMCAGAGGMRCVQTIAAVAEVCNGLDDDCDGSADEDGVCPEPG